jgi:hypothetical protein
MKLSTLPDISQGGVELPFVAEPQENRGLNCSVANVATFQAENSRLKSNCACSDNRFY